jgi:hypothetical protein
MTSGKNSRAAFNCDFQDGGPATAAVCFKRFERSDLGFDSIKPENFSAKNRVRARATTFR